jgi:hypothetical protein
LTPRQRAILECVAAGPGTAASADRPGCARDDVRRHLAEASAPPGPRSVPDAVAITIRRGLIEEHAT